MDLISETMELRRELPVVMGNVDYRTFEEQLVRIDELLRMSGAEEAFIGRCVEAWAGERGRKIRAREQRRYQRMCQLALRCNIARRLTESEYRKFTRRLAESELLRWFCRIERLDVVHVPSKSALQRYEALAPEAKVRELVNDLSRQAAQPRTRKGQPLGLAESAGIELYFADTTCLKANIHFPVDWVLLRDAVRTLMKGLVLIRRQGLKHRMEEPSEFLRRMNALAIGMTQSARRSGSRRERKRILRQMKRLSRVIGRHAQRYVKLLQQRWPETEWTEGQARCVWQRLEGVLEKLPEAIRQAHERIIGGRLVPNDRKMLSLYEGELHVIVRGKANAEVEFGNTLFVGEQNDGLVVDWKLLRDHSPGDARLLEESLARMNVVFDRDPDAVGTDRGFDRSLTREYLESRDILNGICARSPERLREQRQDEAFEGLQRRRSQTEGRIGILQNEFLGRPLRSKGFEARELAVAWAVLAHNLWVIARLPQAAAARKKKAA